jgi:2-oxoglutarate/2-oxoacid ferredoxin oxidoreductase subunit beta
MVNLPRKESTNTIGLIRNDYAGKPTTLCKGCGHTSIANMIVSACFEMNIPPEKIVKFSGIGCSSKSAAYFLERSFGFNGLHGRMPSIAEGALFADKSLIGIGISGDGDTANIGLSQFKHLVRRNVPMVYIVENNGVYGLTKGQFSATSEKGLTLKRQGENPYLPVDIALEAIAANASFVARSFAGDPMQVKELIKAAISHRGTSIIDIISPCVSFNNQDYSIHSYSWGKGHEAPLHVLEFIPPRDEITLDDFERGSIKEVTMHDGSVIVFKKLAREFDPTNRTEAIKMLEEAIRKNWLITGLIYVDPDSPNIFDMYPIGEQPLNRLSPEKIRPDRKSLETINQRLM